MSAHAVTKRARRGVDRYGWQGFAKEAAIRPLRPALAPVAAYRLRRCAAEVDGIDPLLDLAFGFDAFGITIEPGQVRCEFRQLLERVAELRPRRMLEIGTANGGSLFALAHVSAPDAHVISVDLPRGEFGGGYPLWKVPLYKAFARPGQRLDLLRGDSHDPRTVAQVEALLGGEPLDLLFIDGDHTYGGVREDFESYGRFVRPNGLIGLHDIAPPKEDGPSTDGTRYLVGEVPQYWNEIRQDHAGQELVDSAGPGCFGIGLVRA